MRAITLICLFLTACHLDDNAASISTSSGVEASLPPQFQTTIAWTGDSGASIPRPTSGDTSHLTVNDPVTIPALIPESLEIDLPPNSSLSNVGEVKLMEIGTRGVGTPFSLGSSFTTTSGLNVAIGGLRSWFKDSDFKQGQMTIQAVSGSVLTINLRTPPTKVSIDKVSISKDSLLEAPNRALAEVEELKFTNNNSMPVELSFPIGIKGTLNQHITNYAIGLTGGNCSGGSYQIANDASINEEASAYLFIKDAKLPFDWVSRGDAKNLIFTLQPGESKTLGLFLDSPHALEFFKNGVSYGQTPMGMGIINCGTRDYLVLERVPSTNLKSLLDAISAHEGGNDHQSCGCDPAPFRNGTWGSRPTFNADLTLTQMNLRWGDLSKDIDPEARPIPWMNSSISIF